MSYPHLRGTPSHLLARRMEVKVPSAEVRPKPTEQKIEITEFFPPFLELFPRTAHKKARRANLKHKSAQKKIEMSELFASLALFFPRSVHKKPRRAEVFSSRSELFHPLFEHFWRTAEVKHSPTWEKTSSSLF